MLSRIEENGNYLDLVLFSDESTFHVCGKVNRHNCRIWGSENPHQVIEYERDTPKLNVWLGLHKHGVYSDRTQLPQHVGELCSPTDTSRFPIPAGRCPTSLPQRCYHISGWDFSSTLGRKRSSYCLAPQISGFDTIRLFFVQGFIKDVVYSRKVRDLSDLRQRIIEAVELITPHMLINTWQELEYRLDICRATTGAHIEVYGRA